MKVSLALESKTKTDLTLESRGSSHTWNTIKGTWNSHLNSTWNVQREQTTLESKTKDSLTLENK